MKRNSLMFPCLPIIVRGVRMLLLGFAMICCSSALAQVNLLGNPSFESPIEVGATNWTLRYVHGGPDDWDIKDRTTVAATNRPAQYNDRGLHFRPTTQKLAHIYATQTVTGLQQGHSYTIKGSIWGETVTFNNAPTTFSVYFEAIGGGPVATSPNAPNEPGSSRIVPSITQTPDADGKIEVRLHLDKYDWTTYSKQVLINGYFDDFWLYY